MYIHLYVCVYCIDKLAQNVFKDIFEGLTGAYMFFKCNYYIYIPCICVEVCTLDL